MMKALLFSLLALAALPAAQGKRMFTGTITDSECTNADREGHLATIDWHNAQLVLRSPARITKDEGNAAFDRGRDAHC